MSLTPASCSRRLTAGEATRPVPRGAGMSCTTRQHEWTSGGVGEVGGNGCLPSR